ncbi:hypothetical protein DFH06DRAFT_1343630 [Mycena polygramma]|nr:hypothetical protein DFH06DRAFT_1343630 [Mycena polygramma]
MAEGDQRILMLSTSVLMSPFPTCDSIPPSSSAPRERRQSLRERCGFAEYLSFAPAFPNIPAKGHLGPTAGNLPRRKRSSVASIPLPAPVHAAIIENGEFFGASPPADGKE